MSVKKLFSVKGRSTRTAYWVSQLLFIVPYIAVLQGAKIGNDVMLYTGFVIMTLMFIPVLFISIKRWHDLNKSGVYVLINLVPYIGNLIAIIWQGFLKPVDVVDEYNTYGANPRNK